MADLTGLIALVEASLNATGAADLGEEWTEAELWTYADEALKRLALNFGLLVDVTDEGIAVTANQADCPYPDGHLATIALALDGSLLRPANVREMEARGPAWATQAGTPTHFIQDALGNTLFRLWRVPTTDGTLVMVFRRSAPDVSAAAPTAPLPAPVADALAFRTLAEARRKETDAQMPEVASIADQLAGLYEQIFAAYWGGGI